MFQKIRHKVQRKKLPAYNRFRNKNKRENPLMCLSSLKLSLEREKDTPKEHLQFDLIWTSYFANIVLYNFRWVLIIATFSPCLHCTFHFYRPQSYVHHVLLLFSNVTKLNSFYNLHIDPFYTFVVFRFSSD